MHDDLIDGVNWAGGARASPTATGSASTAAPTAATPRWWALTFTPDVFAAAVSVVGPVEPGDAWSAPSRPTGARSWRAPGSATSATPRTLSSAPTWRRAPRSTRVADIRRPLLVIQGANDPRVTKAESDQIVAALRARGVTVEYLVKDDEGHGFVKPENRLEAYGAIERFFATHLGGRVGD